MKNDEPQKAPSENALIEALIQNWLHCRHLENERLNFTSIYSIIVAGALALLGEVDFRSHSCLLVFLLVLSILGFLLCLKIDLEFNHHMQRINIIMDELHLWNYLGVPTNFSNKLLKLIRVRYIFITFYILSMIMWIYLLIIQIDIWSCPQIIDLILYIFKSVIIGGYWNHF